MQVSLYKFYCASFILQVLSIVGGFYLLLCKFIMCKIYCANSIVWISLYKFYCASAIMQISPYRFHCTSFIMWFYHINFIAQVPLYKFYCAHSIEQVLLFGFHCASSIMCILLSKPYYVNSLVQTLS